jgi:hypothetical protein
MLKAYFLSLSELRQTRFIVKGIYIPKGILPKDEIWINENEILLKQTDDDELSAFVISNRENYSKEEVTKKISQYLSLWALLTHNTPTIKQSGFNDISSIEEAGTDYFVVAEFPLGSRLRLSKELLIKSKEVYQKTTELNKKFSFLETSNNFYYNATKPTFDTLEMGKFNSRQFIDAAVSLESLFNEGPADISYKLCMRTAFLLGFLGQTRIDVFKDMKRLYRIRNDIVHGIADETPTLNDTGRLLEYATKCLQCCYILSYNRKDRSKDRFKRNLLEEIDQALLDHDKGSQLGEEINSGIKDFSMKIYDYEPG